MSKTAALYFAAFGVLAGAGGIVLLMGAIVYRTVSQGPTVATAPPTSQQVASSQPTTPAKIKPPAENTPTTKPAGKPPVVPPVQKKDDSEKAPPPPAETAKSLLEKGREQYRKGDFVLAEQTWLKGIDLCGPEKDEQELKAEMYLRVGLAKEDMMKDANNGRFNQRATLPYYERFYKLLRDARVEDRIAAQRQLAIQNDQYGLRREYILNKNK